jgi:hypothetical protein
MIAAQHRINQARALIEVMEHCALADDTEGYDIAASNLYELSCCMIRPEYLAAQLDVLKECDAFR